METRLRRFINNRRSRAVAEPGSYLPTQSAPYEASSISTRPPIFLYQPLARSELEIRKQSDRNTLPMRSFSYDQAAPGKTPVFIDALPVKGNGPVKLQANRRLSSGELIPTVDDDDMMLQDIKDGEYLVGRKERPMSPEQGRVRADSIEPRLSSASQSYRSPVLPSVRNTPKASQTWPNTPQLGHQSPEPIRQDDIDTLTSSVGLGLFTPSFANRSRPSKESQLDYRSIASRRPSSRQSPTGHEYHIPGANATLEALRKAEYARLVEIYGSETAARNIAQLDQQQLTTPTSRRSAMQGGCSPTFLEPLLAPPIESREIDLRRTSRTSGTSESCCDDWSGSSSSPRRQSCVSSYAESHATARTSLPDEETVTTREDIRTMVEQMRSKYLDALEHHVPQNTRFKTRRKKPRNSHLMPSPAMHGAEQFSLHPAPCTGRKTWHPNDSRDERVLAKRRVNSQPTTAFGRLSPIQASPNRNEDKDSGLQRADSATLGSLMAEMTRENVKTRRSSKQSARTDRESGTTIASVQVTPPRPITPQLNVQLQLDNKKDTWLDLDSDSIDDSCVESPYTIPNNQMDSDASNSIRPWTANGEPQDVCFDKTAISNPFFEELFGNSNDADNFWATSSPTTTSSSLPTVSSYDSTSSYINSRYPSSTPRKVTPILSIPESPEYTSLARGGPAENNFI